MEADYDSQYEQHLITQAIAQIEVDDDPGGHAARYLVSMGVCPHCFEDAHEVAA